ncbi:glycosyl hydrolase family 95 catalytic domain-containing protein [Marinilactibacillus piezotolerans]|uniref:glycosyl hydrolase family 95 catalytic domain-containing protein n=1 Tax=Marinilactibacillus piezotolerans TaxID=258723 RepID=UPI0009B040D1|nr:glycoside hydrolase N-terminal domain-containing protein [Marinilactibacillus piezotolerans]
MFQFPEKGIWSTQSAEKWQEGYFVGNGESGGILFGDPHSFHLIANHHHLFLKKKVKDQIPNLAHQLPELRKIIKEEGYQAGIEYYFKEAQMKGYTDLTMSDPVHPASELLFVLNHNEPLNPTEYIRWLNYEKGTASEVFTTETGQKFEKTVFSSKAERGLFFEIQSNQPFQLSVSFKDYQEHGIVQTYQTVTGQTILQKNRYVDDTYYDVYLNWTTDKGTVQAENDSISFEEVYKVQLKISIKPDKEVLELGDFKQILEEHTTQFQQVYNQIELNLADSKKRTLSFETLIEKMEKSGEVPTVLYEKLYDASRYFIQSMSGRALPNLQGIWAGDFSPAWSGDYTLDTNVQLAIASFAGLGLFEHYDGLFSRMKEYDPDFKKNAMEYFGCRGYLMPVHASTHAVHVHWNSEWPLIFWTSGAGWFAYFYNEYYEYTLDKTFLKETAIPFYIETLQFYEDFLMIEQGEAVIRPSYSAENGMGDTPTMDVAVIKAAAGYLKQAYHILGKSFPSKYETLLQQLPDYRINEEGVLKEWIDDQAKENPNHRHFSNLYPVFQTKEITKETPELWQAAHRAFDERIEAWLLNENGDTSSSHGRMHAAMCAIALERKEIVEASLEALATNQAFYSSLATSHYNNREVFNMDANGSLPKVLHDSLIYVEKAGVVTLFKAVPCWMSSGTLKGVRLPDGVKVNQLTWDLEKGQSEIELEASHAVQLTIQLQDQYEWETSSKKLDLTADEPITLEIRFTDRGVVPNNEKVKQ